MWKAAGAATDTSGSRGSSARAILSNLVQAGALEENAGRAILAAVGDKALAQVPRESRDAVRADILRQVLILQV